MESIFLIIQMPIKKEKNEIYLEQGVFIGIEKWAENFEKITLGCQVYNESDEINSSVIWKNANQLNCSNKIEILELGREYNTIKFIKLYLKNRQKIREAIKDNKYLCFAGGGFKGEWGTVAAIDAILMKRKYAAWTDRVEYNVLLENIKNENIVKKIKKIIFDYSIIRIFSYFIFKRAELSLLHGNDCFSEFKKYSKNPFLVHNIHISAEWKIKDCELEDKIKKIDNDKVIKISYAGRVSYEKGVFDWIDIAIKVIKKYSNVEFNWYGDGEELEKIREKVIELNLYEKIKFHGFIGDKQILLNAVKESEIFMFCHKTKESPRNLIESLILGTPIVGYYSEYPEDLIKENNGGILCEKNNIDKLYNEIEKLLENKEKLKELIKKAAKDGKHFDISEVFKHRSDLIKNYQ